MSDQSPRLAPPDEVRDVLGAVSHHRSLPDRLRALTERFLGRPYLAFPLVGGADRAEELVTRLDCFDCVTFVESMVALALSTRPADFPKRLVELRYLDGRVSWETRNHYWTSWIRRNTRAKRVAPVRPRDWVWGSAETRELSILKGYPVHRWRPRYWPSSALDALARHAEPGDVVGFVSSRPDLDTFHTGLLMPTPGEPLAVRHAGRSRGQVVHQDLAEFLKQNDMPGMLIVRPLPRRAA
jgi:hypothetical protein